MEVRPDLDTQQKLRTAVGMSQSTIGRVLNAEVHTGLDAIDALAKAFGVDPTVLITPIGSEAAQEQKAQFESFDTYVTEVKRLLIEKNLRSVWVDELLDGDKHYLERAYGNKTLPVYAAFEVYVTEEESAREPVSEDQRLKLDIAQQVRAYLQQLVKIGLWGDSVECVATNLIYRQIESKLEAGHIRLPVTK